MGVMMTQPASRATTLMRHIAVLLICGLLLTTAPELRANPPAADDLSLAAPISGTLFIGGGGKIPDDAMAFFVETAGGPNAHLVIITTASETADNDEVNVRLEFWRRQRLGELTILHTRDRHIADDPKFTAPLETATGVWFIGGHQQRLTDAYLGTRTERAIKGVLDRGGIVGGTSAGAAIMSQLMIAGGAGENRDPELATGFGLLPGTIVDQHFLKRKRRTRLVHALEQYPKLVGLGIDENTALVVQGRKLSVRGESAVVVYQAPVGEKPEVSDTLLEGMEADLLALKRTALSRIAPRYPFDRQQDKPQAVAGTLVIAGGGEVADEAADEFIEAAGGPESLIVVVTTGLGFEPDSDDRSVAWLEEAGAKNIQFVHPRNHAEANSPAFLQLLKDARGVWFTGGRQWRLIDALEGTRAEQELHAVLTRGGVIGGNGGGASILADYLVRGNPLSNKDVSAPGYEDGFGFLRGVAIDPFFTQRNRYADMAKLKRDHPNLIGLGIDEETALIVKNNQVDVVGKNHVVVYDRNTPDEADEKFEFLFGGERYDLAARTRLGPPRNESVERPVLAVGNDEGDDPEPQPPLACEE